jgi:hypothetical protein
MNTTLSRGAQIAGASAVVLLIDMFLSWYGVDLGGAAGATAEGLGIDTTATAWQAFDFIDVLLLLTVLVTAGWIFASQTGNELAGQLRLGAMGGGALCALLVLYRIVNQPGPNDIIKVKYGVFIGLLACIGIAYGAAAAGDETAPRTAPSSGV